MKHFTLAKLSHLSPRLLAVTIIFVLAQAVTAIMPILPTLAADQTNLIANPSLAVGSTTPDNWYTSAWGTNTATHTLDVAGQDGTQGATVNVSNYQDGDAKWYFGDVKVQPSKSYTFSNYYKATVDTETIARYTNTAGAVSYVWLGDNPTSSTWRSTSYSLTTPSDVASVTVFHNLRQNGTLSVDNYSLYEDAVTPPNTDNNLIPNPSAETVNGSIVNGWSSNKWGTNTAAFTVATPGQEGSRSLSTQVNSYASGDAKWYFNAVTIKGGETYRYTNWYRSTAEHQTMARFTLTDGTYFYQWIATNPVSSTWKQQTQQIVAPANATQLTVFNFLEKNGQLWVDNFGLYAQDVTPQPNTAIANASFESSNGGLPTGWATSSWGANDAKFTYEANGRSGTRSAKVAISQYTDGDAKWYFNPIALTPGAEYKFVDYYKASVDSRVIAAVSNADGVTQYMEMPTAPAAADWTQYNASFQVPAGAVSLTIFHMISRAGTLQVDDYAIEPYKVVGFNQGLVTLTFDDSWEINASTALPIMQKYGVKSNQFYATTFMQNPSVPNSKTTMNKFVNAGHEMGSHSITHPDLTTLSASKLESELRDSQTYMRSYFPGHKINYFATPYGAYNANVKARIMNYYTVHRTVDTGYNSKDNFDVSRLKVQNVLNTTTPAEVDGWVKKAKADKTWLVLVYHRVATNPGPYDTTITGFDSQMKAVKASGVPVKTITGALTEINPQLSR